MLKVDLIKIRELRKQKNITQDEMAKHLGYKTAIGYHYLEKGRCQIKAEQLAVISKVLEVPMDKLYAIEPAEVVGDKDHGGPAFSSGGSN